MLMMGKSLVGGASSAEARSDIFDPPRGGQNDKGGKGKRGVALIILL
jgi:hypothetical protein